MTRYLFGMVLFILASLFLLGCPAKQKPTAPPPPPQTTSMPSPHPGMAQAMKSTPVTATLTEYKIVLTPSVVPAGNVLFSLMNKGKMVHSLEVEGQGIKKASKVVEPGKILTFEVMNLKPGTYTVDCPIDNHTKLGMKTTLTVKAVPSTGPHGTMPPPPPMGGTKSPAPTSKPAGK